MERIEDAAAFQAAHDLGIALLQGHYLLRPIIMEMCLRLLGVLASAEVSMSEIEAVVSGDPGLAVRVLRTASSALAADDPHVAFTTGLLSGVSEILGVSAGDTVRTTGIGQQVADALVSGEGVAGTALRAVPAHERQNPQAVLSNGFTPYQVSLADLEAVRAANAMSQAVAG